MKILCNLGEAKAKQDKTSITIILSVTHMPIVPEQLTIHAHELLCDKFKHRHWLILALILLEI